jgi:hypothetical protein
VESLTPAGRRLYTLLAGMEADELPAEVRELVSGLGRARVTRRGSGAG